MGGKKGQGKKSRTKRRPCTENLKEKDAREQSRTAAAMAKKDLSLGGDKTSAHSQLDNWDREGASIKGPFDFTRKGLLRTATNRMKEVPWGKSRKRT